MSLDNDTIYRAPSYKTPLLVEAVTKLVPRFGHPTEFADVTVVESDDRADYVRGIWLLVSFTISVFFVWAVILVVVKYFGSRMWCFREKEMSLTLSPAAQENKSVKSGSESPEISDGDESVQNSKVTPRTEISTLEDGQGSVQSNPIHRQVSRASAEAGSFVESVNTRESDDGPLPYSLYAKAKKEERKRRRREGKKWQRRGRAVFTVAGFVLLACGTMTLMLAVSSIRQATGTVRDRLPLAELILDDSVAIAFAVENSFPTINVRQKVTFDPNSTCPQVDSREVLGVDFTALSQFFNQTLNDVDKMSTDVREIIGHLMKAEESLLSIEYRVDQMDKYSWVFPISILVICITMSAFTGSALLVWKGYSSDLCIRLISWILLPLVVLALVVVSVLAGGGAAGLAIASDACMEGGSPDSSVIAILNQHEVDPTEDLYTTVHSYTGGCKVQDPAHSLKHTEDKLRTTIDTIWAYVAEFDAAGVPRLEVNCGSDLDFVADGARRLARSLDRVADSIGLAPNIVRCDRINTLYAEVVHEAVCTDVLEGLAYAYILVITMAIMGMTMFSLRCLLYYEQEVSKKDKEYCGVICEHEEYLEYISKHKHEWEEFEGVTPQPPAHPVRPPRRKAVRPITTRTKPAEFEESRPSSSQSSRSTGSVGMPLSAGIASSDGSNGGQKYAMSDPEMLAYQNDEKYDVIVPQSPNDSEEDEDEGYSSGENFDVRKTLGIANHDGDSDIDADDSFDRIYNAVTDDEASQTNESQIMTPKRSGDSALFRNPTVASDMAVPTFERSDQRDAAQDKEAVSRGKQPKKEKDASQLGGTNNSSARYGNNDAPALKRMYAHRDNQNEGESKCLARDVSQLGGSNSGDARNGNSVAPVGQPTALERMYAHREDENSVHTENTEKHHDSTSPVALATASETGTNDALLQGMKNRGGQPYNCGVTRNTSVSMEKQTQQPKSRGHEFDLHVDSRDIESNMSSLSESTTMSGATTRVSSVLGNSLSIDTMPLTPGQTSAAPHLDAYFHNYDDDDEDDVDEVDDDDNMHRGGDVLEKLGRIGDDDDDDDDERENDDNVREKSGKVYQKLEDDGSKSSKSDASSRRYFGRNHHNFNDDNTERSPEYQYPTTKTAKRVVDRLPSSSPSPTALSHLREVRDEIAILTAGSTLGEQRSI